MEYSSGQNKKAEKENRLARRLRANWRRAIFERYSEKGPVAGALPFALEILTGLLEQLAFRRVVLDHDAGNRVVPGDDDVMQSARPGAWLQGNDQRTPLAQMLFEVVYLPTKCKDPESVFLEIVLHLGG